MLKSSMQLRRLSTALFSVVVGGGAWYAYTGTGLNGTTPTASFTSNAYPTPTGDGSQSDLTRKAIVVGPDTLYTGSITGDGPISKETDESGRKVLEMLTPEQATQKLRRNEQSYLVGRGQGVVRYDVVQIPSNDPIEDDHSEKIVELPTSGNASSDWMFWGVYDGHSGWTTSAKLRQVLINFVARELNSTYKAALSNPSPTTPSSEDIEAAIKAGFNRLDHEIVHESVEKVLKQNSKLVAAETLAPALSGSCALLSFYDSKSKLLRVACTGDSRAILGRRGGSGKWTATPLSVDQTGSNLDEVQRMRALHPGEPDVIRNGRVLGGLEPTRAFGDAIYKWSRETSQRLKQSYFGRTPSPNLRSPPYVTAEPVVTTTKIQPEQGDFVVMATDGLWEMLTNEEVVGLVGQWLDNQHNSSELASAKGLNVDESKTASSWTSMFTGGNKGLPVEKGVKAAGKENPKHAGNMDAQGQKTPIRQQQWGVKGDENSRFVVEDKNAATHLVRNALGGRDKDMVCALLTLPSPYSRRYRYVCTIPLFIYCFSISWHSPTFSTLRGRFWQWTSVIV